MTQYHHALMTSATDVVMTNIAQEAFVFLIWGLPDLFKLQLPDSLT